MRGALMRYYTGTIQQVIQHTRDVTTLVFDAKGDAAFRYTAGQYITVIKPESRTPEGKAYSLSSWPGETHLSITVKDIGGEYSHYLCSRQAGDQLTFSAAYGYFNPLTDRPLVGIAAGVGISPVWSIIKSEYVRDPHRNIQLMYSNRTVDDIVFAADLAAYEVRYPQLSLHHFVTRQATVSPKIHQGRIDLDMCINSAAHYLVCGSVAFTRAMWQGLTARGIASKCIATEVFFE